ncbi:MAG TPA: response regulator [Desulfobacteraceae bacterium]|nr:response regulator [Desulfobacteraceae bacterium]
MTASDTTARGDTLPCVLIVDDEPDIAASLSMLMTDEGYEAMTAANGREALDLYVRHDVDVVITDIRMPVVDGLSLLREIKRVDPYAAIIVMTGFASVENVVSAMRENGAFDYLLKPIEDMDILSMAVSRAFSHRRLKLENEALLERLTLKTQALGKKNRELEEALETIKVLEGILPICSGCRKIRDDKGYWQQLEKYIEAHADVMFSHGICEECARKIYGDEDWFNDPAGSR